MMVVIQAPADADRHIKVGGLCHNHVNRLRVIMEGAALPG